jgi:hypothetical protein
MASDCPKFPFTATPFTVDFKQPVPPLVKPEFEANYIQHKWYCTNSAAPASEANAEI